MVKIVESVEIKRPIDRVFAYSTDAQNWPRWQSTIPEAERTSPGPVRIGTTFRGAIRMMGRRMKWTAVATQYEPPGKFGKDIACGPVTTRQHNTYEALGGGTKLTIVYDVKAGGLMALFSPFVESSMRKALRKALDNLKAVLEAQP